jgi:hypothetical protein
MNTNTLLKFALAGLLAGAATDISAFRTWKSVDEALAYNWKIALWRWFQGAVVGLMIGLGVIQ